MTYTPDSWVVVKITSTAGEPIFKVLASWYGGFDGSDNWKLNSGIKAVTESHNSYEFWGYSGSVYRCWKNAERMNRLTHAVYSDLEDRLPGLVEVVPVEQCIQELKNG